MNLLCVIVESIAIKPLMEFFLFMSEYNLDLAEKFVEAADAVRKDGVTEFDSLQAVIYLSLLSTEISLKALLEQSGISIDRIRKRSHNLKKLLEDVGSCEVEVEILPGSMRWRPATCLLTQVVDSSYDNATIGAMIEKAANEASSYPTQLRYGDEIRHFPPDLVLKMAKTILAWTKKHWNTIRYIKAGF